MFIKIKKYKKFLSRLIVACLATACLTGCTNQINTEKYEKDSTAGEKVEVPLAQIINRKDSGEQMLVVFVQDGCSYCEEFDKIADDYLKNHNVTLNVVNLTKEEEYNSKEDIKNALKVAVGGVKQTPSLFYIENKDAVHLLDYSNGDYTIDSLTQFIEKYKLDSKKDINNQSK